MNTLKQSEKQKEEETKQLKEIAQQLEEQLTEQTDESKQLKQTLSVRTGEQQKEVEDLRERIGQWDREANMNEPFLAESRGEVRSRDKIIKGLRKKLKLKTVK